MGGRGRNRQCGRGLPSQSATGSASAEALGLPLVVAARPGLGTINHTLLTLEAAAALDVRAVVLTPWPDEPSRIERSNLETIGRLVPCATLARDADAGALPVAEWLGDAHRR